MPRPCAILLLMGTTLVVLGGAIFLSLFNSEPMWAEWLLGPFVVCVGLLFGIVGITLHCYSRESEGRGGPSKTVAAAGRNNYGG